MRVVRLHPTVGRRLDAKSYVLRYWETLYFCGISEKQTQKLYKIASFWNFIKLFSCNITKYKVFVVFTYLSYKGNGLSVPTFLCRVLKFRLYTKKVGEKFGGFKNY